MFLFQGHEAFPGGLGGDIFLSLLPVGIFLFLDFFSLLPKIGKRMSLWDILLILSYVLIIPNTVYAFFEIKHLFFIDTIADSPNFLSYVVFIDISLLGLACSLLISRLVIKHYAKNSFEQKIYSIFLGLINGAGVTAGLIDLNSWDMIIKPHHTITSLAEALYTPHYFYIFVLTAIVSFVVNLYISQSFKQT